MKISPQWLRDFVDLPVDYTRLADELTLVRSMTTDSVDHESALRIIHGGKFQAGRPTWGSWVIYGLGTERADLPAYVVLGDYYKDVATNGTPVNPYDFKLIFKYTF